MYPNEEYKSVTYPGEDYAGRTDQIYKPMTRALHENGAGILLGQRISFIPFIAERLWPAGLLLVGL
jgi:hypothetical protein